MKYLRNLCLQTALFIEENEIKFEAAAASCEASYENARNTNLKTAALAFNLKLFQKRRPCDVHFIIIIIIITLDGTDY